MSDFAGLRIALSSLYAQRRGLELSAHNVANANTEGYSRQRIDLTNLGAPAVPAMWSKWVGDGLGVRVADVVRFRDQFMEIRAALEHGNLASLDQSHGMLDRLEQLFDEPSDTGIGRQLSDFWAGWDDVANHPGDAAARTQLLERTGTLVSTFNAISSSIAQTRRDTIGELSAVVDQINATADTVGQLNQAIKSRVIAGLSANDLMDQRDLLANKLAELSGATVRHGEFDQANLYLGGTSLVTEEHAEKLMLDTTGMPAVIRWQKDNFPATVMSGRAGGMLNTINTTLPGYLAQLDAVATKLRDDVNGLHGTLTGSVAATARDQSAAGNLQLDLALDGGAFATVTVAGADWSGAGGDAALEAALQAAVDAGLGPGNAIVSVSGAAGDALAVSITPTGTHKLLARATGANVGFATLLGTTAVGADGVGGRRFFEGADAAMLAVSADVAGNPEAVAAGIASGGPLDGSRALDVAELASSSSGADAAYRSLIVGLGVDAQTTKRRDDIQQHATARLDEARQAQSGVSIDEEMVNMVQFQHAYEAAARFMTSIDEMLDTLVNRTGVSGR